MSSTTSNHIAPSISSFQCSRTVGRCPRPYWGCTRFPGTRLECRQEYFNTKNSKGYASIQFWFHIEIQLGFYDGEVRSNLTLLKTAEAVFFLAADTFTFKQLI